jgi:hypothetical protein
VNDNKGAQGHVGTSGYIGNSGVQGATGAVGDTGLSGLCFRGSRGVQGPTGNFFGNVGPIGPPGTPGLTNQIYNTSFTTSSTGLSYSNAEYTDVTGSSISGFNTITLPANQRWAIYWSINQNWADPDNMFYISFKGATSAISYKPFVFKDNTPYQLNVDINNNSMCGTGNDSLLDLSSSSDTDFTIELWMTTNSPTPVIYDTSIFNISLSQI